MLTEGRFAIYGGDFEGLSRPAPYPFRQVNANDLPGHLSGATDRAFPYDSHPPSVGQEGIKDTGIPLTVPFDLRLPECQSACPAT